MEGYDLVVDLTAALLVALVGGLIAHRLRQPTILGYLAAGVLLSPRTFFFTPATHNVQALAEFGIILLLFSLGVELRLAELGRVRNVAIYGGAIQIVATIVLGGGLGLALGYPPPVAFFFGALIALSSTVIVVRVLMERGEMDSTHGRVMLGICLVQDLSLVILMALLPVLGGESANPAVAVALALAKAALLLLATYFLGTRVVPRVLYRVASTRSRELFVVTIVCLALGTAAAVSLAGLSLELGAFLAGLVVSESQYSHQTLADVLPLRDLFAVLFFVSIGMLIEPAFLLSHLPLVAATVLAIVVIKFLVVAAVVRAFRYPLRTAIYAGSGLVQIGEFSFVLASIGVRMGVLPEEVFSLTLAAALVTIPLTPASLSLAEPAVRLVGRIRRLAPLFAEPTRAYLGQKEGELSGQAVIVGYGNVGQMISQVLAARRFPQVIIDHDPHAVELARQRGLPCLYGDGANLHVLEQVNLPRARLLALTLPDPIAAQLAVANAVRINPRLDVVVRAPSAGALRLLRGVGACEVINPTQEVALEMTRHALHRFGVSSIEALAVVNRLRAERREEQELPP